MTLTRTDIADDFDAVDEQIAELNAHKRQVLVDYREHLAGDGMGKDEIKLEIEATKAAIKRRRAVAKDGAAVEEKDALVDEIFEEITCARARRATRVENKQQFPVDREERRRHRTSESMDDAKALSAEAAALGLIDPAAHAETRRLTDAIATKYGNGPIPEHDADTGEIIEPSNLHNLQRTPDEPQSETAVQMHQDEGLTLPNVLATTSIAGSEGIADQHPIQPETAGSSPQHLVPTRGDDAAMASSQEGATGRQPVDTLRAGRTGSETVTGGESAATKSNVVGVVAPRFAVPGIVVMETCPPVGVVAHPYIVCWPLTDLRLTDGEEIHEPIVKSQHFIVDGRKRYFAARDKSIAYPVVQYDGTDLLADVIRWNLASRSMSEPALRIVAQKLAKLEPDRAGDIEALFGHALAGVA